jgi:hypothetical protein
MATYLVTYHGSGGPPPTPEGQQQAMAAFGEWVASVGDAMVDPGAPLAASRAVSSGGTSEGSAAGPIAGYTLLRAPDLDAAVRLVENHPFISRGGALQVSEAVNLSG